MIGIPQMILDLEDQNDKIAYQALLDLTELSKKDGRVANYWQEISGLLNNSKSYERIRALVLLGVNGKWLKTSEIQQFIGKYLALLQDEKPIVVRKVLEGLFLIVIAHPVLLADIKPILSAQDYSVYKDTMRPLLEKDTQKILDI